MKRSFDPKRVTTHRLRTPGLERLVGIVPQELKSNGWILHRENGQERDPL